MSEFQLQSGDELTLEELMRMKPEEWALTQQWHRFSVFPSGLNDNQQWLKARFGNDSGGLKSHVRQQIKRYIIWKSQQKSVVPESMQIDRWLSEGKIPMYTVEKCTVAGSLVSVGISRVPVPDTILPKVRGQPTMRPGSDALAIMVASSTRWTGKMVAISLPDATLDKFQYEMVYPMNVVNMINDFPQINNDSGLRGRAWAYALMAKFQVMPKKEYYEFMSSWVRQVFNLGVPHAEAQIHEKLADNVTICVFESVAYWVLVLKSPGKLRGMRVYLPEPTSPSDVYDGAMSYATVRQGDKNGLALLTNGLGSWGLCSSSQVLIEQIVSLILGMAMQRIVINGLTHSQLIQVRASIASWRPKYLIYEHTLDSGASETLFRTDDTRDSLYINVGSVQLPMDVPNTKIGKRKQYQQELVIERCWTPADRTAKRNIQGCISVYYGACIPPLETAHKLFYQVAPWNCMLFVSSVDLTFASLAKDSPTTLLTTKGISQTPLAVYKIMITSMNRSIASWASPPVHNDVRWAGLIRSATSSKMTGVTSFYSEEDGEFQMIYTMDEEDAVVSVGPTRSTVGASTTTTTAPSLSVVLQKVTNFVDDDEEEKPPSAS